MSTRKGINMTTTTSHFQKNPDYFMSVEECKANVDVNTNPRYPYFKQTHFTAGDEDQFEQYRDPTNGSLCSKIIDLSRNIYADLPPPPSIYWEKYRDLTSTAVDNTFKYLFFKMKKAIFIKIKNNEVSVFLPFSNARYVNEWGDRMKLDPRFPDYHSFFNYSSSLIGKSVDRRRINNNPYMWYGNNCLVRTENPLGEGDASYPNMADMFRELCAHREVPDCEFFVNKRDFPLLKNNDTEAYDAIFGEDFPLVSHKYTKYAPVMSMVTTDKNADIPIPTWEDWARVSSEEDGKFFETQRDYRIDFNTPWDRKRPIAVFRGASTGCGTTEKNNIRIRLAKMNRENVLDDDGLPFIDAGITTWNNRPRKEQEAQYLTTIEKKEMDIGTVPSLSPEQQSEYKYVINVDGHVSAYRLSLEMRMGSVVLLAGSKYRMWYHDYIQPWVHYVPVKEDLSDLYEKVKWCKEHDAECQQIVKNATEFNRVYLNKNAIFDYLQNLLVKMKEVNGHYLYSVVKPENIMIELESKSLNPVIKGDFYRPTPFVYASNCYGFHRGVEMYFQLAINNRVYLDDYFVRQTPIVTPTKTITPIVFNGLRFIVEKDKPGHLSELIHEAFVGCSAINELTEVVPNFMYTFGLHEKRDGNSALLLEYIVGETLDSYLSQDYFDMEEMFSIFIQIALALRYAQDECGFIHWDLLPHNIILKKMAEPVVIEYPIGVDKVYRVTTSIIPVMIDYGRSQVVVDGVYHNPNKNTTSSSFQDLITLIIGTLNKILTRRLDKRDFSNVFELANWLTGNSFRREKFTTSLELKEWVRYNRKFSQILLSDKGELGDRDSLSLVEFIHHKFRHTCKLEIKSVYEPSIPNANEKLVFQLLNGGDNDPENIFIKYLENLINCSLPIVKNPFMKYQAVQEIERSVEGVVNILEAYRGVVNTDRVMELVKTVMSTVRHVILSNVGEPREVKYVKSIYPSMPSRVPYLNNDFDDPFVLEDLNNKNLFYDLPNYVNYRSSIVKTLLYSGESRLPSNYLKFYIENFSNILSMNPFAAIIDRSYGKTYRLLAIETCEENIRVINWYMEMYNNTQDCRVAEIYLEQYKRVLYRLK